MHTRHPPGSWLGADASVSHHRLLRGVAGTGHAALPPATGKRCKFLCDLQIFVARHLDDELLWAQSMPCRIPSGDGVPIAVYGSSNPGQDEVRVSAWPRVQVWTGHADDLRSALQLFRADGVLEALSRPGAGPRWASRTSFPHQYMGAIRNYRRLAWLLIYLFGASPAFCKSFPTARNACLRELDADTWFAPHGTSLRMSDIGYRNRSQSELQISMNSLDDYLAGMVAAVTTSNPRYESPSVCGLTGKYRQLNANTLQIEAEYYTPIRPKPPADSPYRPTVALRESGVRYLEVRTLDLNMLDPLGVNSRQLRFVEAVLLYCLLTDSPPIDSAELEEIDARDLLVAREGAPARVGAASRRPNGGAGRAGQRGARGRSRNRRVAGRSR